MAARTPGSTTRDSLVSGGIYAFIGAGGLAIFFINGGGGRHDFIPQVFFLPVISVCFLGLASLYLIPAVASYRRERGGKERSEPALGTTTRRGRPSRPSGPDQTVLTRHACTIPRSLPRPGAAVRH